MFMNHQLPECVQMGAQRAPWWSIDVAMSQGGQEQRNLNWLYARHKFDIGYGVAKKADFDAVNDHFHMARGKWRTWLMKDALDYEVLIGQGFLRSLGGGEYQLFKVYGTGDETYFRKITRPMVGAVIYESGVPAVGLTIDYDTGVVSGGDSPGPAIAQLSWRGAFMCHVRYDIDEMPAAIVDRAGNDFIVSMSGINVVEVRE